MVTSKLSAYDIARFNVLRKAHFTRIWKVHQFKYTTDEQAWTQFCVYKITLPLVVISEPWTPSFVDDLEFPPLINRRRRRCWRVNARDAFDWSGHYRRQLGPKKTSDTAVFFHVPKGSEIAPRADSSDSLSSVLENHQIVVHDVELSLQAKLDSIFNDCVTAQSLDLATILEPIVSIVKAASSKLGEATQDLPELQFALHLILSFLIVSFLIKVLRKIDVASCIRKTMLSSVPAFVLSTFTIVLCFGVHHRRSHRHEHLSEEGKANKMYADMVQEIYEQHGESFTGFNHPSDFVLADPNELAEIMSHAIDLDDGVSAESGLVLGGLSAALVAFLGRKTSIYRRVADHDKLSRGVSSMLEGAIGGFETVLNLILSAFGKDGVRLLHANEKIVEDWVSSVECMYIRVTTNLVSPTDFVVRAEYNSLLTAGIRFAQEHKDGLTSRLVFRANSRLTSIGEHFPNGNGSARMEPLVIMLRGDPGVGKSTVARVLAKFIARHLCTDIERTSVGGDLDKLVYQKGTSEYWEGYCGQPIVTFDDFLQAKSVPGAGDNEVSTFIRACNQWPYPLNMAFGGKGKVYFTSRFIIMTTNESNDFHLASLVNCPGAVLRRMDMSYDVKLTPGSSLRDLAPSWEFRKWSFKTGRVVDSSSVDLPAILKLAGERYNDRIDMEKHIGNMVDGLVDQYSPPTQPEAQGAVVNALAVFGVISLAGKVRNVVSGTANAVRRIRRAKNIFISAASCALVGLVLLGLFKAIPWPKNKVYAQMSSDDEVALAFSRNVVEIYRMSHGVELVAGYGLFVNSNVFAYNYHYYDNIKATGTKLYLRVNSKRVELGLTKVYGPLRESFGFRDLAIEFFPVPVPGFRCLKPHLRNRGRIEGGDIVSLRPMRGTTHFASNQLENHSYMNCLEGMPLSMVKYDALTNSGDCGSLIILRNKTRNKRILGLHCGGGSNCAYYVPIYIEDINELVVAQGSIEFVRSVPAVHNSGTTAFIQTSYTGVLEKTKLVLPVLRPKIIDGIYVDPLVKAISDTDFQFNPVLPPLALSVAKFTVDRVFDCFDTSKLRKLNFEEAVMGTDHEYIKPIARGKSPGYPYCLIQHNKRKMFGDTDYLFDSKEALAVRADVEELRSLYLIGKTNTIYRDALKDECVSSSKASIGQTRLLCCSPVHYTILWRQYFGTFTAEFTRTREKHGGAVGINPYSQEWANLANRLLEVDDKIVDGDFKQFDKRQHPGVMKMLLDRMQERMLPYVGDKEILDGLCKDVFESQHLGGDSYKCGDLYLKFGSLPTGHPATAVLNSLYNMFLFFSFLAHKFGVQSLLKVESFFRLIVYGDDNVYSRSSTMGFMPSDLDAHFVLYGMKYTGPDKINPPEPKSMNEGSFLKRGFVPRGTHVYAPLEPTSIFDMLNWRKRKTTDRDHLRSVVPAVLRESCAHDEAFFLSVYSRVISLAKSLGMPLADLGLNISSDVAYDFCQADYRNFVPDWSNEEPILVGDQLGHERPLPITAQGALHYNRNTMENNSNSNNNNNNNNTSALITNIEKETTGLQPDLGEDDHQLTSVTGTGYENGWNTNSSHYDGKVFRPTDTLFDRLLPYSSGYFDDGQIGVINIYPINESNFFPGDFDLNIRGYAGYRATMVWTIVVSAPPQAAGILKFAVYPLSPVDGLVGFDKSTLPICYATTQNVELNLAETTTVSMEYKYNFYADFLRVNPAVARDYATFAFGAYTPISGTFVGGARTSFSVYLSFKDVELISPATAIGTVIAQADLEFKAVGPVSTVMDYTRKIAKGVAQAIPSLGVYLRPVSWIASGVGSIAAHFGWSKPNNASCGLMQPTIGRTYNNVLGVGAAAEFGMFENNELGVIDDIGHMNKDEMSICYLTCIPAPIFRGFLSSTDAQGAYKWSCSVDPMAFVFQNQTGVNYTQTRSIIGQGLNHAVLPTPIAFLSRSFLGWRGDIVFRFKFARSKMMGGRVLVGYNAKPDSLPGEVPNARFNFLSKVVDLRQETVVDLEVPYTYPMDMVSITSGNTGNVFMRVLDPLVVPQNVDPTCYFMVEVFSKCGMRFGGIRANLFVPAPGGTPIYAQGNLDVCEKVFGECVMSVKQMAMRPTWNSLRTYTGLSLSTVAGVQPDVAAWNGTGWNVLNPFGASFMAPSSLTVIKTAYRFVRGSYIVNYLPSKGEFATITRGAMGEDTGNGPRVREFETLTSARLPFYSNCRKMPIYPGVATPSFGWETFAISSPTTLNGDYSIVAGDDFQLGAFTGFTLMVTRNNVSYVPY